MRFRPCIDIHNGSVKQIVGSSLSDEGNIAKDNFISQKGGGYYARLYREHSLKGGHIIILNPEGSQYYEDDLKTAEDALRAGFLLCGIDETLQEKIFSLLEDLDANKNFGTPELYTVTNYFGVEYLQQFCLHWKDACDVPLKSPLLRILNLHFQFPPGAL